MMLRHLSILAVSLLLLSSCNDEEEVSTDLLNFPATAAKSGPEEKDLPVITFEGPIFDFGKAAEGEQVAHTFKFTNTGNATLLISSVEASCGCTVPRSWPKEPLQPGEGGEISVTFDTSKRLGIQRKKITVLANTVPAKNYLTISGQVIGPETK